MLHQYRSLRYADKLNSRGEVRPREKEGMQYRESRNEYSHCIDYAESLLSRMRSPDRQSRHHPIQYDNLDEDDENALFKLYNEHQTPQRI